ncbi:OmpA family protein [Spirosoma rigui]|uniref:OmpA family protein n=1 Tax=Spirosoma rigui TaxID=564064 RepID=UPI0009B07171|nr:OmpA family protein [Spirosoma rigui]
MHLSTAWVLAFVVCLSLHGQAQDRPWAAQRASNATVAASGSRGADLPLSIAILYFDQSSDRLRSGVKASLDSIARVLVSQPGLVAAVTGYTDTIGKRELNLALAERRAKTIQHYLRRNGVPAGQILASWEGPDNATAANDSGRTISRRAVIQLYPR